MADNPDKLNDLLGRLDQLLKRQEQFQQEIDALRQELSVLKKDASETSPKEYYPTEVPNVVQHQREASPPPSILDDVPEAGSKVRIQRGEIPETAAPKASRQKSDFEKFIGENLINKIGIAITVIGVFIGAKYAIDHDLISPMTRIILGYLFGLGLIGFAIKLKAKYENFSAVLLSGAMAIMYFITFLAYSLYALLPQGIAFVLMVLFTVFTVIAALNYNKQVIAHLGLVGAYAVPFLLSENTGKVAILFSYMAIINAGILAISFKRYWKSLYCSSFLLTWFIYFVWFETGYTLEEHFSLALIFAFVFFMIFYVTIMLYKLAVRKKFIMEDVLLILANSFFFYGFGYAILSAHETGNQLLGLFTLANALLHFVVSMIVFRLKLADKNLLYFTIALVLTFITIAIPVQLDGSWVTLLWAAEGALLFWIGRTKVIPVYEMLSYPLFVLTFYSIFQDWETAYYVYAHSDSPVAMHISFMFNIHFLSSLIVIALFGWTNVVNNNKNYVSALEDRSDLKKIVNAVLPVMLIIIIYSALYLEISTYWNQLFAESRIELGGPDGFNNYAWDLDLPRFGTLWLLNYTELFITTLSIINLRKFKNVLAAKVLLGLGSLALFYFLFAGLLNLSDLRHSYQQQSFGQYYNRGVFNILFRYVCYLFAGGLIYAGYQTSRMDMFSDKIKRFYDLLVHFIFVWIASSELLNLMNLAGYEEAYKLALSILWGIYASLLIARGILVKKKHLRIGAITLFGVTLIKLFFYDLSDLSSIGKTVVLISLGILLLIVSFLYTKYKNLIFGED